MDKPAGGISVQLGALHSVSIVARGESKTHPAPAFHDIT